jgi:hypothetical protein
LGAILAGESRYVEAEPLLGAGHEGLIQRKASVPRDNSRVVTDAGEWVVRLYESWGKAEIAAAWREKVRNQVK